jgi:phage shock protein A
MSIWQRLKRVVKAQANSALDKLEDPEKELDMLEDELEEEKRRGRQRLADAMVEQKRLEKEVERAREESAKWEKKAMRAVELGDDDLAREALLKKADADAILTEQKEGLRAQEDNMRELKHSQTILEEQIEAAKRKRHVLKARIQGAKLKENIGNTLSTTHADSAMADFDRMAREIEKMEAEVEMNKELSSELAAQDVERKLRELETKRPQDTEQDDPLAALKAKMKANRDA